MAARRTHGFFHDNGLSIVLGALFLALLAGQAFVGQRTYNSEQRLHSEPTVDLRSYVASPHFLEAVFENWESEFLQMAAYVVLTIFLFQRGSSESKDPDRKEPVDASPWLSKDPRAPGAVRRGGWQLALYQHSLTIALIVLFLGSFVGHALSGLEETNAERLTHGEEAIGLGDYIGGARFWFESLQNWQSEFLAVLAIVTLSIHLRQRGSPESKPVAAPHSQTGIG